MSIDTKFASADLTAGQLNALVEKIMRQTGEIDPNEAVRLINSGEWVISKQIHSWSEQDSVIRFILPPTDGTTGPEWERWYDKNGYNLSGEARFILNSPDFKATNGVTTEIAILKGVLFKDKDRTTDNIQVQAYAGTFTQDQKLFDPNAEVICLICKSFSDEEMDAMGLRWIVAMHKPINDFIGDPRLLFAFHFGDDHWLDAYHVRPDRRWDRGQGFAFAASQVGPQN